MMNTVSILHARENHLDPLAGHPVDVWGPQR